LLSQLEDEKGRLARQKDELIIKFGQAEAVIVDIKARKEEAVSSFEKQLKEIKIKNEGLSNQARMADDDIRRLQEHVEKATVLVDETSLQVNLLALNIARETARAGEAAKGFTAIVEEAKSLALRTAKSTKDTASFAKVNASL